MRRLAVPLLAITVLLACPAQPGRAQSAPASAAAALPRPEDILNRYLETHEDGELEQALVRYAFRRTTVVEDLDDAGAVEERMESLHEVFPIKGEPFPRLLARDGEPLTPKQIAKEREREERFRRKRAKRRDSGQRQQKSDDELELSEELFDRYHWELPRVEEVDGRPAYLLVFEPKQGELPVERRIDRALNRAAGMIWIDVEDIEVARVEAHLIDEITFWGGLLGRISSLALRLENRRTSAGDWVPCEQDLYIRGRFLLRSIHRRTNRRMSGHTLWEAGVQQAATEAR